MGMVKDVRRFDVFLVNLDPTIGSEIKKTRPVIVISPNEMNRFINTVIIAPMTSRVRKYPSRVAIKFKNKKGEAVLDQIRTVDKTRLIKKLGIITKKESEDISATLLEIFQI